MDGVLLRLGIFVPLENFLLIWIRHYDGEGLQILTFVRHIWPLSSEGSLACHPYIDKGHRLKWSSPRTRDTHTLVFLPSVLQWNCHYLFWRHGSVAAWIIQPSAAALLLRITRPKPVEHGYVFSMVVAQSVLFGNSWNWSLFC